MSKLALLFGGYACSSSTVHGPCFLACLLVFPQSPLVRIYIYGTYSSSGIWRRRRRKKVFSCFGDLLGGNKTTTIRNVNKNAAITTY